MCTSHLTPSPIVLYKEWGYRVYDRSRKWDCCFGGLRRHFECRVDGLLENRTLLVIVCIENWSVVLVVYTENRADVGEPKHALTILNGIQLR